ncbi:MAG: hypothetical protein JW934_15370 [Anaerolineae bacterium]|nr:hypothetical protein [Anaerolineae bacterium]
MTETQLAKLVAFRLRQAQETLHEADILLAGSAWRGVVTQAYMALTAYLHEQGAL